MTGHCGFIEQSVQIVNSIMPDPGLTTQPPGGTGCVCIWMDPELGIYLPWMSELHMKLHMVSVSTHQW